MGVRLAAIVGIIGLVTSAVVAGTALHEPIKTPQYVRDWHKNASDLWQCRASSDLQLNDRINDLETAVLSLGDQLYNIDLMKGLKCDWNESNVCITPLQHNESYTKWKDVRKHLLGQKN